MARLPRYAIKNQPQHIIQQGRNGQQIFFEEQDYQYFHDCLEAAAYNYHLKIHAYVLMPNHVHLLATPGNTDSISRTTQSIGRNYVQYFNECIGGSGTIWEGRYRATVVDSERYLLTAMRYIELNPVGADMVAHPRDYRWSSYGRNARGETGQNADWLALHREYRRLGSSPEQRQAAYRQLFRAAVAKDDLRAIRDCTHKGWALGSTRFSEKIEALTQRRAVSKCVGRPRK